LHFKDLTWSVHGAPQPRAKISSATVKVTMAKSFNMWKDVSELTFRRLADNTNNADIIVKFGVGNHGDFYPFDGRGGTLAHGFYPGSNTGKFLIDLWIYSMHIIVFCIVAITKIATMLFWH
jgi:hypothetical protein